MSIVSVQSLTLEGLFRSFVHHMAEEVMVHLAPVLHDMVCKQVEAEAVASRKSVSLGACATALGCRPDTLRQACALPPDDPDHLTSQRGSVRGAASGETYAIPLGVARSWKDAGHLISLQRRIAQAGPLASLKEAA